MVQSIHAVLRNALESAVREEIIPRNVAKLVQVSAPRYKVNRGLTAQQAKATMAAAAGHRLSALYVLALYLGLRRGELLGLRWQDVDLDEAKLEVVHTLQRVGGALRLVPPKTEDSARTVPLPPVCVEALRAHQQRQAAERARGVAGLGGSRVRLPVSPRYPDGAGQPAPELVPDPPGRWPGHGTVS